MARDILTLTKSALYRSNALAIPSALVAATDASALQLLHLLYAVHEELRAMMCWPQLKRTFKVRLVAGQEGYDLPANFYSLLPFSHYDRTNSWATQGPMTDADWNLRLYGTDFAGSTKAFRFFGTGGRQFKVNPVPGASDAGTVISFDYVCRDMFQPPPWTASEASLTQNLYRSANGIIYKKTDSGSDTGGTTRPTMEFGEGQDGSVRWLALTTPAWGSTTLYAPGDYVVAGGARLYRCTVGGTSSGSAPTSTTVLTDITDGTVTWRYFSAASWAGETTNTTGDYILISSQYYRCEVGGITGKVQPTWTTLKEVDNTVDWTFQDMAYEVPQLDTDFSAFDEELVIAGLRAKLFQARGLGADDLVYSYEKLKRTAVGRWNAGKILDMAAGGYAPGPYANLPEGNWPTW